MKRIEKLDIILTILVIIDILLIIGAVLFNLSNQYTNLILLFDTLLCIILILNFIMKLGKSRDKVGFFNKYWLDLFASLPLGLLILPFLSATLYTYHVIILIRILRLILLFRVISKFVERFLEATYLDKIMAMFIIVIVGSTLLLYLFDPSIGSLYGALWFVFQTITTVGYGDIIPQSPIGKFVSLILLIVGVLMFSIFTASFAYLFNNKVFREENKEFNNQLNQLKEYLRKNQDSINEIKEKISYDDGEMEKISKRLDNLEENTNNLSERIDYLIEIIEKK